MFLSTLNFGAFEKSWMASVVSESGSKSNSMNDITFMPLSESDANHFAIEPSFLEQSSTNTHPRPSSSDVLEPPKKKQKKRTKRKREEIIVDQDSPVQCKWDKCTSILPNLEELGKHLTAHIQTQKKDNRSNRKSGYVCKWEDCTRQQPFKGCYNLEHHLRYQHTGEKPYKCKWCTSMFAQRSDLSEHLIKLHNKKPSTKRVRATKPTQFHTESYHPFSSPADKANQLTTPRDSPIPILPAPQEPNFDYYGVRGDMNLSRIKDVEVPHDEQLVIPFSLNTSSILRSSLNNLSLSMGFDFPSVTSSVLKGPAHPSFSFPTDNINDSTPFELEGGNSFWSLFSSTNQSLEQDNKDDETDCD